MITHWGIANKKIPTRSMPSSVGGQISPRPRIQGDSGTARNGDVSRLRRDHLLDCALARSTCPPIVRLGDAIPTDSF